MPERIGLAAMLEMENFNKGLKQYTSGIERMNKDTTTKGRSMTKMLSGIGKTVGKVMVAGIAAGGAAIAALGVGMAKLAIDAAPLQGIKTAFEGITAASGIAADEMLTALKESAAGMITGKEAMEAYNTAAMLVGVQFANELPKAMQYLTKVSAATGESMDFMMSSLVKGIGRLSPMILDNLGIQVDLTQAYEDYAAQMGITVEEMTKTEQQTALMNQAMMLLQRNTAAMPEVTGSAAAAMGSLRAQLQDTKDEIGLALLPVFTTIMGVIGEFADEVLPKLVDVFNEHVVPALEWVMERVDDFRQTFSGAIAEGLSPFEAALQGISMVLGNFLPESVLERVWDFMDWAVKVAPSMQSLTPILVGVGTAATVAFGVWAVSAAKAAIATIAATWPVFAIAAAVGVLYAAWVNDWGGIRTFLVETWERYLRPIFNYIRDWLGIHIPQAIELFHQWWKQKFELPLRVAANYIETEVLSSFREFTDWLKTYIPLGVAAAWAAINFLTAGVATLVYTIVHGALPTAEQLTKDVYALAAVFQIAFPPVEELTGATGRWAGGMVEAFGRTKLFIEGLKAFYDEATSKTLPVLGALTEGLSILAPETTKKADKALKDLAQTLSVPVVKAAREAKGMLREIAATLQELTVDWIPKLAEVFGVRMREMFEDAKNIRGELEELFSMGGVFGGLARAAAGMLEARTLDPLRDALEAIEEEMAAIEERGWAAGIADFWRYQELQDMRLQTIQEIEEHEARILALQERQMELGFLQQQVELLKLIEDYDLNIEDIMGGMELGIEANAGDVLDAMVRAMQEVIKVVEEELGILSPSRIFMEMGAETMKGLALGMAKTAGIPMTVTSEVMHRVSLPALFQRPAMTMPTSTSSTVNVSMGGVSIYDQMSAAVFEARVRQIMASSVGG